MELFGLKKKLSWFDVFVEINLIFVFVFKMLFELGGEYFYYFIKERKIKL